MMFFYDDAFKIIINEFYSLKSTKRSGWLLSGRGMHFHEVESVADHSWCATIIAELLLPESYLDYCDSFGKESIYTDYDKNKIIRMLLVHDLAESYTGDVPKNQKNSSDEEKEKSRFELYKSFSNVPFLENTELFYGLWIDFSNSETINSIIARDIDQLECYLQLAFYKKRLVIINGVEKWNLIYSEWTENLNIRSKFGCWLKNSIQKMFFVDEDKNG